jgi:uncharacterized protein YceH (UPF0502 family)
MHPLGSAEEVERRLEALAARPVPYVRRLERRPREHAARWTHLLGRAPEGEGEERSTPTAAASPPPAASGDDRVADLEARLDSLEREVADLRDRLERLLS